MVNNFSITVATVNGSGSQSSNNILMRSIFRMGIPVEGKNIFPSNIAGLPTWFTIRVNDDGFTSRQPLSEIFVAMNPETFEKDFSKIKGGGWLIYNQHRKIDESIIPKNIHAVGVDFSKMAGEVSKSIQLKKLLVNMIYVGVLAELLGIPEDVLSGVIQFQFKGKEKVFEVNNQAVARGRQYIKDNPLEKDFSFKLETRDKNKGKVLIDGNTAGALGSVSAGCTFASWYPITPSSSMAENFEKFCEQFHVDENGKNRFAILQAEDELSAIAMVTGAGWAGARAMTMTSGPGVSLMNECIGLMYFAEIPGVIWNVQRMGPSTGLPTRTAQGDLMSSAWASHGDSRHPVLLPSTPAECFTMAHDAFNLAEETQTLVFVLTDLDLGMNFWSCDHDEMKHSPIRRGKVLDKEALEKAGEFARYKDVDGDGIPYRTLPGTEHDLAAYFTRGTGHDPAAKYSEDHNNHRELLDRLAKKWKTISKMVPKPEIKAQKGVEIGVVYYGSTAAVIPELVHLLEQDGVNINLCRVKAYPFSTEVLDFIRTHEKIIVLEQNQFGQMAMMMRQEYPEFSQKIKSALSYDGLTLAAEETKVKIKEVLP
jgi:2-oxoglutarate/2-oxoacid ferredoxin oxidoreductase subunit alpha